MTKVTIAELQNQIAELQAQLEQAQAQPQPIARGKAYLEGPVKFFKQARKRDGELMNFYEFVLAEEQTEQREDGSTYKIELPYDQCRVSGNRKELVQQMEQLTAANRFLVLRLHGAWRADGIPTLNAKGYAKAPYKCFWVTRIEVLNALPKGEQPAYQRSEPVSVPAAAPVVQAIDSEVLSDEEVLAMF